MQCYDTLKYRLLGYNKALNRYILTDRKHNDNEICVREAIIKNNNGGVIVLPQGNPNDEFEEIHLDIFERQPY